MSSFPFTYERPAEGVLVIERGPVRHRGLSRRVGEAVSPRVSQPTIEIDTGQGQVRVGDRARPLSDLGDVIASCRRVAGIAGRPDGDQFVFEVHARLGGARLELGEFSEEADAERLAAEIRDLVGGQRRRLTHSHARRAVMSTPLGRALVQFSAPARTGGLDPARG